MADIRMFRAVRPVPEKVEKIAALPYDVYNRKEATEVVKKSPDSFLAIDRAETSFDESVDTYDERVYIRAKELLDGRIAAGDFVAEEEPMYYIYALTMEGNTQHGFVACASIDDYESRVIKKHENTREDKEQDRIRHVDTCDAQTGPIFLAYRQTGTLRTIMQKKTAQDPLYDWVSEDGIRHQVWQVADGESQREIREAFAGMDAVYIADGHHRCASAVKVGLKRRAQHPGYTGEEEFNFFLSVLFPEEELRILDYNRVLKDLNGMSAGELLQKLETDFAVEKLSGIYKPTKKGEFSLYLEENWYKLTAKPHCFSEDPVENLDVSILQSRVFAPHFGIEDPKTDKRIDFVGGIRGLSELEKRCREDCRAAFALYPTDIQELFAVADAGRLMPPKSTWFEPKLRSGIFIHSIR
ncbi:DUF1015 domain-containing protein [bacterium 1XD8-76]|nr:DUF1015 domain-containing protein [bacterium 1XD8-76]